MYDFNPDSGRLFAKRADGLTFDLDLRKPLTIIQGDSATGKTLLCNLIEEDNVSQDEPAVQVLNYKDRGRRNRLDIIYDTTVKLFIIDNADVLLIDNTELLDYINRIDHLNQFLVFSRCIKFRRTPNYFGTLEMDGSNVIRIKYVTNVAGWF